VSGSAAPTTIDAYLDRCTPEARAILQAIRALVHEEAPDALEAVKYGLPTFVLDGTNLVHVGAFARHVGVYPIPATLEAFTEALAPYKRGKGSVQFPLDRPIPYDLIRRMVRFRVDAVRARAGRG
jgi:uncharacterized protein YdhG (YjbR/CyaY superfamily)